MTTRFGLHLSARNQIHLRMIMRDVVQVLATETLMNRNKKDMIIKLDITKRQLSYIIAAMNYRLRTDDITKTISDPDNSWSFKTAVAYEYAQRCELLAMLERTFNSTNEVTEEQDDE